MALQLPEYRCPFCRAQVTLVPLAEARGDLHRCTACQRTVSLQPDGALAVPLPRRLRVTRGPNAFEVAVTRSYVTFGLGDSAIRFRVEPAHIAFTAPTWLEGDTPLPDRMGLFAAVRFGTRYQRLPRAPLKAVDWRMKETGVRATNSHDGWFDVVFVAHDGSEVASGHRFRYLSPLDGFTLTMLLEWAHAGGVPREPEAGGGYRAAPMATPAPLRLVDGDGKVTVLA